MTQPMDATMDEVVGRVTKYLAQFNSWIPSSDDVPVDDQDGRDGPTIGDLKALLAAYQLVREERDAAVRSDRLARLWVEGARAQLATPPSGAVTEAMVKAGVQAFDAGVPWRDVQGQVRAILVAALSQQGVDRARTGGTE